MILATDQIREKVNSLAQTIGAGVDLRFERLPDEMKGIEFATFVFSDTKYHLVLVEKRQVRCRRATQSLDELLYWIFRDITFGMAVDFELHNRRPNEDFRRQLFEIQLSLLDRLSSAWRSREVEKLNEILAKAPYSDVN